MKKNQQDTLSPVATLPTFWLHVGYVLPTNGYNGNQDCGGVQATPKLRKYQSPVATLAIFCLNIGYTTTTVTVFCLSLSVYLMIVYAQAYYSRSSCSHSHVASIAHPNLSTDS